MNLKSIASTIRHDVVVVWRNLPVIRKSAVTFLTSLVTLTAAFQLYFPGIAVAHITEFTSVSAFLVGLATWLGSKTVTDEAEKVAAIAPKDG